MSFLIGVLTFLLIVNCAVLVLLVLIQLPKKDAGAGLAFGGGAADALFGAGSGNALTKITKYATIVFFLLAMAVGILQDRSHLGNTTAFEQQLKQIQTQPPASATTTTAQQPAAAPKNNLLAVPLTSATNPATAAPTNSSAK